MSRPSVSPHTGGELAALLVLRALELLDPKSIRRAFPNDSGLGDLVPEAIERIEWLKGEVIEGVIV